MKNLKSNSQRAKNAITLVWIVTAVELLFLTLNVILYRLYERAANGELITMQEADSIDSRAMLLGFLYIAVLIVSAITFIMWFRRAYNNLHQRVSGLEFSEGWAAGSWFVPIVNLGRPYKIMREMYRNTINFLKLHNEEPKIVKYIEYIGWWWGLWLFTGFLEQFANNITKNAESLNTYQWAITFSIIGNIFAIPLALITIKIIKDYNSLETQLIEVNPIDYEENNYNANSKPESFQTSNFS